MARLIDADELEKVMTEDWFLHILVTTKGKDAMKEALKDCIDSVPLAYDVEKVVAELEKGLKNLEHNKKLFEDNQAERGVFMCDSEITAFKMAIGIVKRGGTE